MVYIYTSIGLPTQNDLCETYGAQRLATTTCVNFANGISWLKLQTPIVTVFIRHSNVHNSVSLYHIENLVSMVPFCIGMSALG